MAAKSMILSALACAALCACAWGSTCPPPGFDTAPDFKVEAFISAPWYVQKQEVTLYQQQNALYCVKTKYTALDPAKPRAGLQVSNYANQGKVNGSAMGDASFFGINIRTIALPENSKATGVTAASKLKVGLDLPKALSFLGKATFGPYWVAAVGPSTDPALGYDWAIIVGGSPKYQAANKGTGCRPTIGGSIGGRALSSLQYKGGLWLFSRKPVDPEATALMLNKCKDMGLDVSELQNVVQQGCTYSA